MHASRLKNTCWGDRHGLAALKMLANGAVHVEDANHVMAKGTQRTTHGAKLVTEQLEQDEKAWRKIGVGGAVKGPVVAVGQPRMHH